jgi:hypothetical protein
VSGGDLDRLEDFRTRGGRTRRGLLRFGERAVRDQPLASADPDRAGPARRRELVPGKADSPGFEVIDPGKGLFSVSGAAL